MAERDEDETTKLDRDLAAAKKKVEAKRRAGGSSPTAATKGSGTAEVAEDEPRSQRKPRLTDEEKEQRDRKAQADREERKATRTADRQRKRDEKLAARQTPHLSKVKKALEQLPELTASAKERYDELVVGLNPTEVNALGLHLQHFYRHHATESASSRALEVGQKVKLLGGGAKYVGRTGVVVKLQRIRCYVKVEGIGTPAYVFTSETEDAAEA
jgi:hypothetical protein